MITIEIVNQNDTSDHQGNTIDIHKKDNEPFP
jgi:hypothetical protein